MELNKSAVIGTSAKSWKTCPDCGQPYDGARLMTTAHRFIKWGRWETETKTVAQLRPCGHEVEISSL